MSENKQCIWKWLGQLDSLGICTVYTNKFTLKFGQLKLRFVLFIKCIASKCMISSLL